MSCPDNASNHLPIAVVNPCGTPYITVVQNPYDSQEIHYGMSHNNQNHDSNSHTSQRYMEGPSDASQNTSFYPISTQPLLKSDMETMAGLAGHTAGCPTSPLFHQTSIDFKEEMLRNRHIENNENIFMEWMYPPTKGSPSRTFAGDTVQWGSDSMFGTGSRSTRRRVGVRQLTQFRLQFMPGEEGENEEEDDGYEDEDEEEEQDGEVEDARSTGTRSSPARSPASSIRKGSSRRNIPKKAYTDDSTTSVTRPLNSRCEPKGQRKKLTIEQKRSNHIRHEKKRRGLIRDGFNDLTELVPELRGGTWSRSRILFKAVEFLKTLLEKNEALQDRLDAMEAGAQNHIGISAA